MISTGGKYVWMVSGGVLAYALIVSLGLAAGVIHVGGTALCIALLCFVPCLWFANAYLEVRESRFSWGLVASAVGWGVVSLAFLVPEGWRVPFSVIAAAAIAAGGVAAWLSVRTR